MLSHRILAFYVFPFSRYSSSKVTIFLLLQCCHFISIVTKDYFFHFIRCNASLRPGNAAPFEEMLQRWEYCVRLNRPEIWTLYLPPQRQMRYRSTNWPVWPINNLESQLTFTWKAANLQFWTFVCCTTTLPQNIYWELETRSNVLNFFFLSAILAQFLKGKSVSKRKSKLLHLRNGRL